MSLIPRYAYGVALARGPDSIAMTRPPIVPAVPGTAPDSPVAPDSPPISPDSPPTNGWPDATNTGVPAGTVLTNYTGQGVVTIDGTLIENKIIEDTIEISAANVTIRNCRVQNSGIHGIFGDHAVNLTVDHCDIIGSGGSSVNTGILSSGTFTANDISGFGIGIALTGPGTVRDNYVHDLFGAGADRHYDSITMFGGQHNVLIEHNTLWCPSAGGTANVTVSNQPFGSVSDIVIRNNLCRGGPSYSIYIGGSVDTGTVSNVSVVDNHLERGAFGYFTVDGPSAAFVNISGLGNVDYLTGEEAPFPDTNVPPVFGPISFGGAGTYLPYGGRTNSTLAAPASIVDGNLLLAFLAIGGSATPPTPTPPAGWSTLPGSPLSVNDLGFFVKNCVFYKIAAGESGDYLFTTAAGNSTCGVICRYTGVDTANPFSPTPTANSGSGTSATALGFTTTVENTFVIYTEQDWGANSNDTFPPSGSVPVFAERVDQALIYIADGTVGAPRSIFNVSHQCNNTGGSPWTAFLIGLKPGPVIGPPVTVFGPYSLTTDDSEGVITIRHAISPSLFINGEAGATQVRITHQWGDSPNNACDVQMYFGRQAASGDPYDFDGKQVIVSWAGLLANARVAGQQVTSDWITLPIDQPFDPSKTYIVSFHVTENGAFRIATGQSGQQAYFKTGVLEAGVTNASNYIASTAGLLFLIEQIEVRDADIAVTLQAIDGETMTSPTTMSHDYYARNGFTYPNDGSFSAGKTIWSAGMSWDNTAFYAIGCFFGLYTDVISEFLDLGLNVSIEVTGGSDMATVANAGIWMCGPDTPTDTWNAAVMGIHVDEQDPTPFILNTPLAVQNGRCWDVTQTWNQLVGGDIGGVPMSLLLSKDYYSAPSGTKRSIDQFSIDVYWFAGSAVPNIQYSGGCIFNGAFGSTPATEDEMARGSNYGNMIDVMRAWANGSTQFGVGSMFRATGATGRIPIFALIENNDGLFGEDTRRQIKAKEFHWAVWSSIIHGARGMDYFTVAFNHNGGFSKTILSGDTISIYDQCKITSALIQQLAPVINSPFAINYLAVTPHGYIFPRYELEWRNGGIEACVHKYQGAYYIFATTRNSQTVSNTVATFTVNDPAATVATVIGESRTIPIVGGQFTDTFAHAWTVHIYQIG